MARYGMQVVLAKTETTYGTDAGPSTAANAMLFQDVDWNPMEAERVERPYVLPYYGNPRVALVATRNRLAGGVDLAGRGIVGSVPAYAALLRACGLVETITPGTQVDYTPVSGSEDSATLYHFLDGTRQQGLGARGDFTIELIGKRLARIRFELQALYVAPTAVALPTPTVSNFRDALVVSQANTPTATLNGQNVVLRSFNYAHGNQIAIRDLPNRKGLVIGGRTPRASVTIEAPDALSPDFFAQIGNQVAFSVTHGITAGNIVTIDLARVQPLNPRYSNEDGVALLSLDLNPVPSSAGNDEFRLRFT